MPAAFRLCALAGVLVASGCGGRARIVQVDMDRYQMTVYATPVIVGSGTQLLSRAWKEAGDLCTQQGKTLQPALDASQDADLVDRTAYAQMNFRCVNSEREK